VALALTVLTLWTLVRSHLYACQISSLKPQSFQRYQWIPKCKCIPYDLLLKFLLRVPRPQQEPSDRQTMGSFGGPGQSYLLKSLRPPTYLKQLLSPAHAVYSIQPLPNYFGLCYYYRGQSDCRHATSYVYINEYIRRDIQYNTLACECH